MQGHTLFIHPYPYPVSAIPGSRRPFPFRGAARHTHSDSPKRAAATRPTGPNDSQLSAAAAASTGAEVCLYSLSPGSSPYLNPAKAMSFAGRVSMAIEPWLRSRACTHGRLCLGVVRRVGPRGDLCGVMVGRWAFCLGGTHEHMVAPLSPPGLTQR